MKTEMAKGFNDAVFGKRNGSTAQKLISLVSKYKMTDAVRGLISGSKANASTRKVIKRLDSEKERLANEVMELLILKIDSNNVAIFEGMASILKKSSPAHVAAVCALGISTVAKSKGESLGYQELRDKVTKLHPSLTEQTFSEIVRDYGIDGLVYSKPGPRSDRKKTSGVREK
jgi:hypothetical protein